MVVPLTKIGNIKRLGLGVKLERCILFSYCKNQKKKKMLSLVGTEIEVAGNGRVNVGEKRVNADLMNPVGIFF